MLMKKCWFQLREFKKNQRLENFTSSLYKTFHTLVKKKRFLSENKRIDKINYYWLINLQNNKKPTKRFQRTELFGINNNFIM